MTSHRSDSPSRAEMFNFAKSHWVLLPWLHSAADNNGKKIKAGGGFPHRYIHTDATLVVAPHCNDSTQHHVARGEHTSAHDHGSLYLAEFFSTDFRAVWVVTNVKTVFMIHVLKRLMLKIMLQSGSCFFVTLCCKKQQDYSIALTCLLSRQSLTWKESCRWASVGLSLTPAVCLYSVGLFKQNKSHLKQLCRFL